MKLNLQAGSLTLAFLLCGCTLMDLPVPLSATIASVLLAVFALAQRGDSHE